jgi:hypothetical protein
VCLHHEKESYSPSLSLLSHGMVVVGVLDPPKAGRSKSAWLCICLVVQHLDPGVASDLLLLACERNCVRFVMILTRFLEGEGHFLPRPGYEAEGYWFRLQAGEGVVGVQAAGEAPGGPESGRVGQYHRSPLPADPALFASMGSLLGVYYPVYSIPR